MIQIMDDMPSNVLGVKATGPVTREDYETILIPALNKHIEMNGKINYLLLLETDLSNFTIGAWIDDAKLGLKNFTRWHKIAIVSNNKAVTTLTDIFGLMIPGNSKGFTFAELEAAKLWVSS